MAGHVLRRATSQDSLALHALNRSALGPYIEEIYGPWDEVVQTRFHRDWFDPRRLWVIEVSGNLVGVLDYTFHPDRLEINRISIDPSHQRRGIGSAVLVELIESADLRRVPATLEVFDINPARRLYERLGFVEINRADRKIHMVRQISSQSTGV